MRFQALLLLVLSSFAHADVFHVGATSGSFPTIQGAVDAAQTGDTIVIEGGFYGDVHIFGKALNLVVPSGAQAYCQSVTLREAPRGHSVRLIGLKQFGSVSTLLVEDCAGTVVLRSNQQGVLSSIARLVVVRSDDVTLHDIETVQGVVASESQVALYRCMIHGRYPAGTGVEALASSVALFGGEVQGGTGPDTNCGSPTPGGTGISCTDSTLVRRDCAVLGGDGGIDTCFFSMIQWDPGPPFALQNTQEVVLSGVARRLLADPIGAAGGSFSITVTGTPGDQVRIVRGSARQWDWRPTLGGVLHITPDSSAQIALGTLTGASLSQAFSLPATNPGDSYEVLLQLLIFDASGAPIASEPLDTVALDVSDLGPPRRLYVDADAPAGGNGLSWATAFQHPSQPHAQGPFTDNYEVWVAEGDYPISSNLFLPIGTSLYGGFEGNEASRSERDPVAHPVLLDGLGSPTLTSGVLFASGSTVVSGFTIQSGSLGVRGSSGGNRLIEDCTFQSCHLGGVQFDGFGPDTLRRCRFVGNGSVTSWIGGAAIPSPSNVVACEFIANIAVDRGGGLRLDQSFSMQPGLVQGCLFSGNVLSSQPLRGGGGLYIGVGPGAHVRCSTFVANDSAAYGGGLLDDSGSAIVQNSIFWRNQAALGGPGLDQLAGTFGVLLSTQYCCVMGGAGILPGSGNVHLDPRFVDMDGPNGQLGDEDDDLRLAADSPLIDAGRNEGVGADVADLDGDGDLLELTPLDLDGSPRFVDVPSVPDTGVGVGPIVDIGAYERQ